MKLKKIDSLGSEASGLFEVYHNIGNNYMEMGQFNNSNKYFNKALEIAEFTSNFPEMEKFKLYLTGANYVRTNELDSANLIDNKISKLIKDEYTILNLDYKNFKGELLILRGDFEEAAKLYKEKASEVTAIEGLNNMRTADQFYRLSSFYNNNLDFINAIKYGEITLEIYDSLDKINLFYYAEQSLNHLWLMANFLYNLIFLI